MDLIPQILITLGGLFLLGLLTDLLGRRTALPRVTLLILAGVIFGPVGLDIFPDFHDDWFPIVTNIALSMVGFLLGHHLTIASLRQRGNVVLWVSIGEVLGAALVVFVGLLLFGVPPEIALLLAGIAPATDPAATVDVVRELKAKGEFSRTLESVVAIDDAWGLLVFSVTLAIAQAIHGQGTGMDMVILGVWEIGIAIVLGLALGFPMAYLTGRLEAGEPTQAEALGFIFLCGGIAVWLDVSFILAGMVLGATVANLAAHHKRPFTAIEGIEWPFMILFFILAGASLHLGSLLDVGLWGVAYILLRMTGLMIGAWVGGVYSHADPMLRKWMGTALWPQAGVAVGMALFASQHLPEFKDVILPIVIASTILFELIGPIMARKTLLIVGEAQQDS